jgi:hypothetical protein
MNWLLRGENGRKSSDPDDIIDIDMLEHKLPCSTWLDVQKENWGTGML